MCVFASSHLSLASSCLTLNLDSSLQISNVCFRGRWPQHPRHHSSGQRPRWWWHNLLHNSRQWGRKLCHWQTERWSIFPGFTFAALSLIDRLSVKSHIKFSLIHSCCNGVHWMPSTFKVNVERYWKGIFKAVFSTWVSFFPLLGFSTPVFFFYSGTERNVLCVSVLSSTGNCTLYLFYLPFDPKPEAVTVTFVTQPFQFNFTTTALS